jgi:hypothetical protein
VAPKAVQATISVRTDLAETWTGRDWQYLLSHVAMRGQTGNKVENSSGAARLGQIALLPSAGVAGAMRARTARLSLRKSPPKAVIPRSGPLRPPSHPVSSRHWMKGRPAKQTSFDPDARFARAPLRRGRARSPGNESRRTSETWAGADMSEGAKRRRTPDLLGLPLPQQISALGVRGQGGHLHAETARRLRPLPGSALLGRPQWDEMSRLRAGRVAAAVAQRGSSGDRHVRPCRAGRDA